MAASHFSSVLNELEKAGTAQNRKVYTRHGAKGEMFGVSFAVLRKMGKRLRPDSDLAARLWTTGNHDARVLACMVDDPDAVTKADLTARAKELDNYIIVDEFAALVAKTPSAEEFARRWKASRNEWLGALSWTLVAHLALTPPADTPSQADRKESKAKGKGGHSTSGRKRVTTAAADDIPFELLLQIIETDIHKRPNRMRHSMNGALIAIGCRNKPLRRKAETAAKRIGKVEVDHGETNCVTPDAIDYIARTWEHKERMAAKRSAKSKPAAEEKTAAT